MYISICIGIYFNKFGQQIFWFSSNDYDPCSRTKTMEFFSTTLQQYECTAAQCTEKNRNKTFYMCSIYCELIQIRVNELDGFSRCWEQRRRKTSAHCLDYEEINDDYISMFLDYRATYSSFGWYYHNKSSRSHCGYSWKITQLCTLNPQFVLCFFISSIFVSQSYSGNEKFNGLSGCNAFDRIDGCKAHTDT